MTQDDSLEPLTFSRCVLVCWQNAEFMAEYRRLTGHSIGLGRSTNPIDAMIDQATQRPVIDPDEAREFFAFVRDYIWIPTLREMRANPG